MNPRVTNLANRIRTKKKNGDKFVLILGAGASISSGVKPTQKLMEELIGEYGTDLTGKLEDKFDKLWKRTGDRERRAYLAPYLEYAPSPGYAKLAELIQAGYFDVALTFNFDDLVEKALAGLDFKGLQRIVRGETKDDQMEKLVQSDKPFKLVKLHGSLESTDHFFFDVNEMFQYPPAIGALVANITGRDLIMCGYAFKDFCVLTTFAQQGGSIVCVNPAGVPDQLRGFLKPRRSEDLNVDLGFDEFFDELHRELLAPAAPSAERPTLNPFKFLESYEVDENDSFNGRQAEIQAFTDALAKPEPPRVIIVAGPAKAGKTSLVKAGLMAGLDRKTQAGVYVRCHQELDKAIPAALWPDGEAIDKMTLQDSLQRLAHMSPSQRIVLFFDQFERVAGGPDLPTKTRAAALTKALTDLMAATDEITLVFVVTDDATLAGTLYPTLNSLGVLPVNVRCELFERNEIAEIIRALAAQGGFAFENEIIEEMLEKYEVTKTLATDQRFTLAHIQAVCHILAATTATPAVTLDSYKLAFEKNLTALNQAINVCDFISFVEDLSWSDAVWFRNMVKVPLKESKERIAHFIKSHYKELVPAKEGAKTYRYPFDVRGAGRPV